MVTEIKETFLINNAYTLGITLTHNKYQFIQYNYKQQELSYIFYSYFQMHVPLLSIFYH